AGLIARHLLTKLAGVLVAHGVMTSTATEQFIGAGLFMLGIAWSAYQKYGKVLIDAALARKHGIASLCVLMALLALADRALAADMPAKAAAAQPAQPSCTPQVCSGFYIGGNLIGVGSNIDVLGSGINNSVFAGGAMLGANLGYQFWNGRMF